MIKFLAWVALSVICYFLLGSALKVFGLTWFLIVVAGLVAKATLDVVK